MYVRLLCRYRALTSQDCSTILVASSRNILSRRVAAARLACSMKMSTGLSPDSRVSQIVGELKRGNISALIIPSQDEHQSEYVANKDKRVLWASGFSGSAGTALVMNDGSALLWTDGRYFAQANSELQAPWTLMRSGNAETPTIENYLQNNLPCGSLVGVDPKHISIGQWQKLSSALKDKDKSLVPFPDVVDRCRSDSCRQLHAPVIVHPTSIAGTEVDIKLRNLRDKMKGENVDMYVLSALDDIAWMLNLRGSDIPCNPVFYAFVIVTLNKVSVFVRTDAQNEKVITEHLKVSASNDNVELFKYDDFYNGLASEIQTSYTVKLDKSCSYKIYSTCVSKLPLVQVHTDGTYVAEAKSVKNNIELANLKEAHIIDGLALSRFFAWLDYTDVDSKLDETDLAMQLLKFRSQGQGFMGVSFDTISAIGSNGAIIHYKPEKGSAQCKKLKAGVMYLCDSGGQYLQGTTDLTRTVFVGNEPTAEQKKCFTLVLEGHVELACAHFPERTQPHQLDVLARSALWRHGLNYNHGTGHGVGAFLGVHEFPPLISAKPPKDDFVLKPGNVLSNEPGYYKDGEFGIRIENVMIVVPSSHHQGYLQFETISYVPIQTKLIDLEIISEKALGWLNRYHEKCRQLIGPKLSAHPQTLEWLMAETEPLTRSRRNVD